MRCPTCTCPIVAGDAICPACGILLPSVEPPPLPIEVTELPKARRAPRRNEDEDEGNDEDRERPHRRRRRSRGPEPMHGAAVASIILGILGCLTACLWPVSLSCAVPGLVCAAAARNTHSRRTAAAGLALCASAAIAGFGFMVVSIVTIATDGLPDDKPGETKIQSFFR